MSDANPNPKEPETMTTETAAPAAEATAQEKAERRALRAIATDLAAAPAEEPTSRERRVRMIGDSPVFRGALLVERDGTPYRGEYLRDVGNNPYTLRWTSCSRCGGAGGSERWRHTGFTCYNCGGSGEGRTERVKLYDPARVEKLNASRDAARDRKEAKRVAEVEARRAEFLAAHGAMLDAARPYAAESTVLASILAQADSRMKISDAQRDAVAKCVAAVIAKRERDARAAAERAGSVHVGTVGEPIEVDAEVRFVRAFQNGVGYMATTTYIVGMRDAAGNSIVYKGSTLLGMTGLDSDGFGKFFARGWRVKFTATVKEHGERNGEKQTIVQRPRKVVATRPAADAGNGGAS